MAPKAKYVSAPTPPEMKQVRQNLGDFLGQYGTQTRGYYPGQINAPVNPYLSLVGSMLSGMFSSNQPNNVINGMPNMNWQWPTMPVMQAPIPTEPQAPQQQQAAPPEKKGGPHIFGISAK